MNLKKARTVQGINSIWNFSTLLTWKNPMLFYSFHDYLGLVCDGFSRGQDEKMFLHKISKFRRKSWSCDSDMFLYSLLVLCSLNESATQQKRDSLVITGGHTVSYTCEIKWPFKDVQLQVEAVKFLEKEY